MLSALSSVEPVVVRKITPAELAMMADKAREVADFRFRMRESKLPMFVSILCQTSNLSGQLDFFADQLDLITDWLVGE